MDAQLFTALLKVAQWHLDDSNAQELTNTAWVFAKTSQSDVQLTMALARVAERCMDDFNARELAKTA